MAAADYRLCDCCDGKVFYDSNLNYEYDEVLPSGHMKVDYLGDWAVICDDCAKTHKTVVLTNEQAAALNAEALSDDSLYSFWLRRDCIEAVRAGDMRAQFISAARAAIAASGPNSAMVEALKQCLIAFDNIEVPEGGLGGYDGLIRADAIVRAALSAAGQKEKP